MQKISSIIPSSPRVSGVDMKSAGAVRPGAPSFGRSMGESTEVNRDGLTTAQKAVNLREEMDNRRRGIGEQPEIVQKMTEQFFLQKSSMPDSFSTSELVNGEEADGSEAVALPPASSRKDYVPPGSYLSVEA